MDDSTFEDFERGSRQTSVFIPNALWTLAKQNLVEFKSAMIFGIKFKIAEKQGFDFPDNSLVYKIHKLTEKIAELTNENELLRTQVPKIDPEQIEKEADDILKEIGGTAS